MNKQVISSLLKLVALFIGSVFLFAGLYIVPAHFRFLQRFAPEIGPLFLPILAYINLSFVPVYLCLGLAWQVFSTIAQDNSFCEKNAKRLQLACRLALVDVAMLAAFFLFVLLRLPFLADMVFFISSLCIAFVGLSASIVCFALSKLIEQAAELKQEVDLTV